MSEQAWNFAGIEGGAGEIQGAVQTTQALLDEGKQSLAKLSSAWGGSGSDAYQAVQQRWDATSNELNTSLQTLSTTISDAGSSMAQTESGIQGLFS